MWGKDRTRPRGWRPALVGSVAGALVLAATSAAARVRPKFTAEQMGGTLRGNFSAEMKTLNPLTSRDVYASIIQDHIFESLIERDLDTLQWKPALASRWKISEDGLTITFHIDPRAKFSDGTPVTADDVLFTFETMRNPQIDAFRLASYFVMCKRCEKVDDRTIRFVWGQPYFKGFEVSGAFLPILPKHVYKFEKPKQFNDMSTVLVGSGPYKFDHWTKGAELLLVRNENHWRNPPAIERILYRFILEDLAAVQAFKSGELDHLSVSPEWWVKLKKEPGAGEKFKMYRYTSPGNGYAYIAWSNVEPPFGDPRVRRAMTHLVDRKKIVEKLLHGLAEIVTGPFWNRSLQYDNGIDPYPYDPAAALRILKEAGWEDRDGDGWLENENGERFAFEFTGVAGSETQRDVLRLFSEVCRRVGIDVSVRYWEWSVFVTHLDNRSYKATMLGWTGTVEGDPFQIWHSSQIAGRGSNHMSFRDAEADRLIEKARRTLDAETRNALYHRFHRILHEQQPYTFLWASQSLRVVSPRIRGVKVHRLGLDTREWWIPKDRRLGQEPASP